MWHESGSKGTRKEGEGRWGKTLSVNKNSVTGVKRMLYGKLLLHLLTTSINNRWFKRWTRKWVSSWSKVTMRIQTF